jgi:HK97 gp10 family phage protein
VTVVHLDDRALRAVLEGHGVTEALQRIGDEVAQRAAQAAPKRTGAGAASIHAETVTDATGTHVRVGWDSAHWYMLFSEIGTSQAAARPFLRPALDGHYDI